mgnify:CR=1 FL=1
MVGCADAAVGSTVGALRRHHMLASSLVLFLSDNGGPVMPSVCNGGLRGGKGTAFDGGVRVPAFVHWPACLGAAGAATPRERLVTEEAPLMAVGNRFLREVGVDTGRADADENRKIMRVQALGRADRDRAAHPRASRCGPGSTYRRSSRQNGQLASAFRRSLDSLIVLFRAGGR